MHRHDQDFQAARSYVESQRQQGVSDREIGHELIKRGWNVAQIRKLLQRAAAPERPEDSQEPPDQVRGDGEGWRVTRQTDGEVYGPYSEDEIREYTAQGRLSLDDLLTDGERTLRVADLIGPTSSAPRERDTSRRNVTVPQGVKDIGFCWAAFLLPLPWVIGMKAWWPGLLLLASPIPYIGGPIYIGVSIYLWFAGYEIAWKNRSFDSVEHLRETHRVWQYWGYAINGGILLLATIGMILFAAFFAAT